VTLNLNYDKRYDVLYVRMPSEEAFYGNEDDNGIVTLLGTSTNEVRGVMIYGFARRLHDGKISSQDLPIPLDFYAPELQELLTSTNGAYECILRQ